MQDLLELKRVKLQVYTLVHIDFSRKLILHIHSQLLTEPRDLFTEIDRPNAVI